LFISHLPLGGARPCRPPSHSTGCTQNGGMETLQWAVGKLGPWGCSTNSPTTVLTAEGGFGGRKLGPSHASPAIRLPLGALLASQGPSPTGLGGRSPHRRCTSDLSFHSTLLATPSVLVYLCASHLSPHYYVCIRSHVLSLAVTPVADAAGRASRYCLPSLARPSGFA
jgi:hypothetical protein